MVLAVLMLMPTMAWADIVIGGNVYGGGKEGKVGTDQSISSDVNAGTPVDANNASTATVVTINGGKLNSVYGGGEKGDSKGQTNVVLKGGSISGSVYGGARMADIEGFAHVLIDGQHAVADLFVKNVYGGNDISGKVTGKALVESTRNAGDEKTLYVENLYGGGNGDYDYADAGFEGKGQSVPNIANTRIDLAGGVFYQVFGGGNAATVTESTTISLNNTTASLKKLTRNDDGTITKSAADYQFERVFGGNNKATMAIRPTWDLTSGLVNNLYSGGNAGNMTHPNGILLAVTGENMTINNVYGGCRMADVNPAKYAITSETIEGVPFPAGYAARTLITNGKINNVYGGNDISGNVYGGCALEIQSSIINDVYGGGNGSYAYSNDPEWQAAHPEESDYFYTDPLNNHRPNAESVYLHVAGTQEKPTYIGGSLYCGGNSATLTGSTDQSAQLKIGSYVIADNVFLGSNGEHMVEDDMLAKMNTRNTFNLTNPDDFKEYMRGVEVAIKPVVTFDSNYETYSTKFGSLYCGGNVGSMSAPGQFTINFLNTLVIYDKIVGGCNAANVAKTANNAFHMGGLVTGMTNDDPKVILNISGVKLEPRKLVKTTTDGVTTFSLAWNKDANDPSILKGGNVYGGCYASGYVNGKVQINVTADAISENVFKTTGDDPSGADYVKMRDYPLASTLSVYGGGYGDQTEIWGSVDVNVSNTARILKVYGGGEMGVVGILNRDADGVVASESKVYDGTNSINVEKFTNSYNTTVTLNATSPSTDTEVNAAKLYAGGFQGTVSGNTILNLNQGRIYDGFGGASNAEILGMAQTYVGRTTAPEVVHNVYGANDFGGQILGTEVFNVDNSNDVMEKILTQTYVEYTQGKIEGDMFGGPCGAYEYNLYPSATSKTGFTKPQLLTALIKPSGADYATNSFVNVISRSTDDVISGSIFGAGEGLKGYLGLADEAASYVRLASGVRSSNLTNNVYGAGYCSQTDNSLVDAFSGRYGTLFGGCYGVTYQERIDNKTTWNLNTLSYMGAKSAVHLYTMDNENMDIYGAGANSGSKESVVMLYGGQARDVYGASFNEGITYAATVDVPTTSTSRVNRIFGGAKGKADEYACDVYNGFINYEGTDARVKDAIYGGNNAYRMMRNTYMFVHVPVFNFENKLTDVFGGGLGPNTVTLYTEVNMENGGKVANVYGGGKDGQVLDTPSFRHYMQYGDRCDEGHGGKLYVNETETYGYQRYLQDYEVSSFKDWVDSNKKQGATYSAPIMGMYTPEGFDVELPLYYLSTQQSDTKNTNVYIEQGAIVAENAYGGGLGSAARVSGKTGIYLHGGTVQGDMYGGGNAGPVKEYDGAITGVDDEHRSASTNVYLGGGSTRNVYGGGLGATAIVTGATNVTMGVMDQGQDQYTTTHNERDYETIYAGDACVERSLYGGGQQGQVIGTAFVTLNQGHVGYKYADGQYVENLDADGDDGAGKLAQNGNAFGGGYGEGASVDMTVVNMYGGTIRNSLYGGGEIAAIGQGTMAEENGADRKLGTISVAGRTHIYMYDGHVLNDVFGGGRGYSYNTYGNMIVGERLYTSGYVFGTTDVNIRGGEIGTITSVAEGHGNVFGGGNIGYCYTDATKKGTKTGTTADDKKYQGRYYTNEYECNKCHNLIYATVAPVTCEHCQKSIASHEPDPNYQTTFTRTKTEILSEDCRVIVSPYAKVLPGKKITLNGTEYTAGQFVPTDDLNYLADKNSAETEWANVSIAGVNIRNAVFAGGNVSAGSDQVYANATTVFGNATATLNDIFFRDLITIGTEHTGGLYGDGNLTFVDGYRELNISNYGTDYYGMSDNITLEDYNKLNDRERAYFELKYKCTTAYQGADKSHEVGESIPASDYDKLPEGEKGNWTKAGFCSIYAGRLLNTIQRADFCGVFGSRMVLQGAQDRVPDVVDYTNYTINRVGELSLNKASFKGTLGDLDADAINHGNYFGIYNVVNYLGALTSDVPFKSVRTYDNENASEYAPTSADQTFYDWKVAHAADRSRNNGTSHNKVALASGVYLELVEEKGSTKENKNYGYSTGVGQLDLINVMPGLGGGYVYAKNEHRASSLASQATGLHENLSKYNAGAVNNSKYTYEGGEDTNIETSGNFIHNVKQIIDDCYPEGGDHTQAAHYWFIKGEFYVYDQYISAYTGSSTAYTKDIKLPLTITAGAHGKLDLLDIKPNYYAYYFDATEGNKIKLGSTPETETVVVNNKTYALNDIITYWDYMQLSSSDKAKFVQETYTPAVAYQETESGELIAAGSVAYSADDYAIYKSSLNNGKVYNPDLAEMVNVDEIIRPSNVVSHAKGYVLTVDLDNPNVWDAYHSYQAGTGDPDKYDALAWKSLNGSQDNNYIAAPTYTPTTSGVYGQRHYDEADIIPADIHDTYEALGAYKPTKGTPGDDNYQATVTAAYVAIAEAKYTIGTQNYISQPGVAISETDYLQIGAEQIKFEEAYVCTNTLELGPKDYVFYGELIPASRLDVLASALAAKDGETREAAEIKDAILRENFSKAYYCTEAGMYGGQYYTKDHKYSALDSWASLSATDRENFVFVYDALDVLVDDNYTGNGEVGGMTAYHTPYSTTTPVDYTATWVGYTLDSSTYTEFTYNGNTYNPSNQFTLSREQYEALPNEQYHFAAFKVTDDTPDDIYIVKVKFVRGEIPYVVGKVITKDVYDALDETQKGNVEIVKKSSLSYTSSTEGSIYYFCRDSYKVNEHGEGVAYNSINNGEYTVNSSVPVGTIITEATYKLLPNKQRGFDIHGLSPTETSTLYVNRESDIYDLSKEKVITVVYQYEYEESDVSMTNIEKIMERHIINIHINFMSGVPTISQLQPPSLVLPGSSVGLQQPTVSKGAYEILGGGWEIYSNRTDADRHQNGGDYTNYSTPMYWYQNGYWVAYYAKTYLGKTYSNPVEFKVANFHDIADVMKDTQHYMYIDKVDLTKSRPAKIYIDDEIHEVTPAVDETPAVNKSELDMFYDLYEETLKTKEVEVAVQKTDSEGHLLYLDSDGNETTNDTGKPVYTTHKETVYRLDEQVQAGQNLEFFLKGDVAPEMYTAWKPIGTGNYSPVVDGKLSPETREKPCFQGNLHGNGHTISGMNNSLFAKLCGNVYNLGVTGTFSSPGIADSGDGYMENCWVSTTGNPANDVRPIFAHSGEGNRLVNGYYVDTQYTASNAGAKAMPEKAFNNGEVAFNLNSFYLHKRYSDAKVNSGDAYKYFTLQDDGTLNEPSEGHYATGAYYTYSDKRYGYVERYYADGDFIYSDGTIPETDNERLNNGYYYPIWPDDYLFFGQQLTYGYDEVNRPYQTLPSVITKTTDYRLPQDKSSNRIFRVPAYFRNSTMDEAYYNTDAYFVAKTQDGTKTIHEGLTALDFTGKNDVEKGYKEGWSYNKFYAPVLDDSYAKLLGFNTEGLTRNLLVYVDDNDVKTKTEGGTDKMTVVKEVLSGEPVYQETSQNYRTVAAANSNGVKGHLVTKVDGKYTAQNDHFLVDKQEFNAPIEYTFQNDNNGKYRMWYQRTPDRYVESQAAGWEGISLPFTAELVTTQQKGEITHFYGDDTNGHEYWLREYDGVTSATNDGVTTYTVNMNKPAAGSAKKMVTNTFLWDYYYNADGKDLNGDDYRHEYDDEHDGDEQDRSRYYYGQTRTWTNYSLSEAGTPYIIGFPGKRYYEFDLSGQFVPENSGTTTPAQLDAQVITFASATGQVIAVSDDEIGRKLESLTLNGYTFMPNYLNETLPVSTSTDAYYVLNDAGSAFAVTTAAQAAVPFRPYFAKASGSNGAPERRASAVASTLIIGNSDVEADEPALMPVEQTLNIWSENRSIWIENNTESAATLTIFTSGGQLVKRVTVQPLAKEFVPVQGRGIYMVGGTKVVVK